MKHVFLLFAAGLTYFNSGSQSLPVKKMFHHLVQSGELGKSESLDKMHMMRFFDHDSAVLYLFNVRYVHHYEYLLLGWRDTFYILNGDNFHKDSSFIETLYPKTFVDTLHYYWPFVVRVYQHNDNYHPTPPLLNLDDKNPNHEPIYPPRKLVKTMPFYYKRR
jgi:hypothetical protein